MNKRIQLITVIVSLFLFIYLSYSYINKDNAISISIFPTQDCMDISAQLSITSVHDSITAYYNGSEDYYLFLPSYAKGKKLSFTCADSISLIPKEEVSSKILSQSQSYRLNDQYNLHILVGSDIPTVYLTLKNDLSYITSNKELTDSGQATILAADGSVSYMGKLEEIKGRGNTSWEQDKKPFIMTLEDAVSLFDMTTSKEYSLITASDISFLRNKISDSMANALGMLTMKRQHINLYINGEYQGIYELCEKISADTLNITDIETSTMDSFKHASKVTQITSGEHLQDWNNTVTGKWWTWTHDDLVETTGGYIVEVDQPLRYNTEASGFTLNSGAYIVSKEPTYLTEKQYNYISNYMQKCEDAMYQAFESETLAHLSAYIDVPSFIAKYLIEEVSKNIDCSSTSQYFYINSEGLLTAGPVWDYDWAYGVTRTYNDIDYSQPDGFSARNVPGSLVWWQILYYNSAFYNDMVSVYNNTLYPYLTELTNATLTQWENELSASAIMDYLKWNRATSEEAAREAYHIQVTSVSDFLEQRIEFLYKEWNS